MLFCFCFWVVVFFTLLRKKARLQMFVFCFRAYVCCLNAAEKLEPQLCKEKKYEKKFCCSARKGSGKIRNTVIMNTSICWKYLEFHCRPRGQNLRFVGAQQLGISWEAKEKICNLLKVQVGSVVWSSERGLFFCSKALPIASCQHFQSAASRGCRT